MAQVCHFLLDHTPTHGQYCIQRGDPHLPQTNMKKRFVIPAVVALVGATAFIPPLPGSNAAKEAKKEAAKSQQTGFVVNRTNVAMLALDCEKDHIRPFLKDPNSFRKLGHTYKETVDQIYVQVNYTATNGFGGRVQGNKVCSYTL